MSSGKAVVVCDLEAGGKPLRLPPEASDVWGLAWGPDGRRLALGLSDGGTAVWDIELVYSPSAPPLPMRRVRRWPASRRARIGPTAAGTAASSVTGRGTAETSA